jgi:hypothetical protein
LDALDFAPEGVIALIKDEAVKTNLNDMSKREAILDKTGFDVTKAIEIRRLSETPVTTEVKTRRVAINADAPAAEESVPARRASTPKYHININN